MATLLTRQPDLDDGIREEIEVLIEEHKQLVDAARSETFFASKDSGNADPRKADDSVQRNDEDTSVKVVDDRNKSGSKNECNEEGIEISVDKHFSTVDNSIDKMITTATMYESRKHTCFSRASRMIASPFRSRQYDGRNSPPPPLSQATTFETATTVDSEPSFTSEQNDRGRDGNSTISRDSYQDRMPLLQLKEFSRLSGFDIATIMEEQQQKREQKKQAESKQEQKKIDRGLRLLQDESESGTDIGSKGNAGLEWLEMEAGHKEVASQIISEMDESNDKSNRECVSDKFASNDVATNEKTIFAKGSSTPSQEPRIFSIKRIIWYRKKSEKALSKVLSKQQTVVPANEDDAVGGEVKVVVASNHDQKSSHLEPEQEVISSSLTLVPESESEEDIGITVGQAEMIIASPPILPDRNSVQLPTETERIGVSIEEANGIFSSKVEEEKLDVSESDDNFNNTTAEGDESASLLKSTGQFVENANCTFSSTLVEEKTGFLEGENVVNATLEVVVVTAPPPPPPPIRTSMTIQECDKQLPNNPEGVNSPHLNPKTGKLSISELLSIKDHPEARGAGPIDLDEVHDQVEQLIERQTEEPVILRNNPDLSLCVPRDEEPHSFEDRPEARGAESIVEDEVHDHIEQMTQRQTKEPLMITNRPASPLCFPRVEEVIPDNLPVTLPSSSPQNKVGNSKTTTSSKSSSSPSTLLTCFSSTSSISMNERCSRRPPGVNGCFVLKHTVIVTMMCVVFGIGVMEGWFNVQVSPDTGSLLEHANFPEEASKLHHKNKGRKRNPAIDLDELLSTLW